MNHKDIHFIQDYQLILFDFDGLLVNTEKVHFQAYKNMCKKYGFDLNWDFKRYIQAAHYSSDGLQKQIYKELPELFVKEPSFDKLYAYKRAQVIELLHQGVELMPGVDELLKAINEKNALAVVVTHSPKSLIDVVRSQHIALKSISHWITREDYTKAKPDPEGYRLAISRYAKSGDKIIGFEDTPRGILALRQTEARPVLISEIEYCDLPKDLEVYKSFKSFMYDDF